MSKKQEPWRVYISPEGKTAGLACDLSTPEEKAVWPTLGAPGDLKELRGLCRLLNKREALWTLIREDNAGLLAQADAHSFLLSDAMERDRKRWAQIQYEQDKAALWTRLFPWWIIFYPAKNRLRKKKWKRLMTELKLKHSGVVEVEE